jgi:CDP-6-deoxy-D-xylo-4-hexulose-3-dehydrase
MTTIEGGMVCTNDKELRDLMLLQRSHGMARELDPVDFKAAAHQHSNVDPKFLFLTTGYNVRSTEINAFIGLRQIKRLDSYIETRQQMYCEFIERLSVYTDYFHVPSTMGNSSFALPLICKSASVYNALKANLELHSVETRPIVGSNLLRQPFLSEYGEGKYANADILHYSGLYIGNNQGMSSKKLDYIFTAIDEII